MNCCERDKAIVLQLVAIKRLYFYLLIRLVIVHYFPVCEVSEIDCTLLLKWLVFVLLIDNF